MLGNMGLRTGMKLGARWRAIRSAWADESGVTAVEFAVVAMPFFVLLFGTLSVCLFYFTTFSVENAVWQASRSIRTGQYQQGLGAYASQATDEDRKKAFKKALCDIAPAHLDCAKAVVMVQSNNGGFGSISPPACAVDGKLVDQSKAEFNAGKESSVVLVTVCYPWAAGAKLPFLKLSNTLADGSLLIQASVAFRTEPYPGK